MGEQYLKRRLPSLTPLRARYLRDHGSTSCAENGWSSCALGGLGAVPTSRFRGPLCLQRSVRLSLVMFCSPRRGHGCL